MRGTLELTFGDVVRAGMPDLNFKMQTKREPGQQDTHHHSQSCLQNDMQRKNTGSAHPISTRRYKPELHHQNETGIMTCSINVELNYGYILWRHQ